MSKRIRQILSIVETLLEQTNHRKPPIDVEAIARSQSIITIGVNSGHSETRKRFTIAHELGHFFLHSSNPLFVDKIFAVKLRDHIASEAIDKDEIEANAFAAELLMPSKLIRQDFVQIYQSRVLDYEDGDELDKAIKLLADKYNVSKQAMNIRLINLGIIPSMDLH